jgi:hypothetical protein
LKATIMGTLGYGSAKALLSYLNLEHGVRMDYPASWVVREQSSPFSFVVAFGSPQEDASDQFQENLTITLQPVFAGITQDMFVQSWQALAKQAQLDVLEMGVTTLANQNVCRVVFNTPLQASVPMNGKVMMFLFVIGSMSYTVAYTGQQGHFETFLPTIEQMLSTLQVH